MLFLVIVHLVSCGERRSGSVEMGTGSEKEEATDTVFVIFNRNDRLVTYLESKDGSFSFHRDYEIEEVSISVQYESQNTILQLSPSDLEGKRLLHDTRMTAGDWSSLYSEYKGVIFIVFEDIYEQHYYFTDGDFKLLAYQVKLRSEQSIDVVVEPHEEQVPLPKTDTVFVLFSRRDTGKYYFVEERAGGFQYRKKDPILNGRLEVSYAPHQTVLQLRPGDLEGKQVWSDKEMDMGAWAKLDQKKEHIVFLIFKDVYDQREIFSNSDYDFKFLAYEVSVIAR